MLNTLPTAVLSAIFDATNSFTTCAALSAVSKRLHAAWTAHMDTINMAHHFDTDPRWRSPKFRFFAVSIARVTAEQNKGTPAPAPRARRPLTPRQSRSRRPPRPCGAATRSPAG